MDYSNLGTSTIAKGCVCQKLKAGQKYKGLSCLCVRLVNRRLQVRPLPCWQHSFVEIDHEIFSSVILRDVKFHTPARICK